MNLTTILGAAAGLCLLAAIGTGYLYTKSLERNGKLEQALTTATTRLKEINDAHRERDKVDGANRALPDDKLFDGLR
jgi:hypothetical protein